jgi:hypothetical protein
MTTAIPRQSKIRRIALIHEVGLGIQAGQFLIFQTCTYLLLVVLGEARILRLPPLGKGRGFRYFCKRFNRHLGKVLILDF